MRFLVACLLLVVACGDDDGGGGESGSGAGGRSGGDAARGGGGGVSGSGSSGRSGGGGDSGSSGRSGRDGGAGGAGSGGTSSAVGKIKLVPNIVAGSQPASTGGTAGIGSSGSALRVGSPSATSLLSLKYYVTSIQLCEDVELMGSGFSSASGCIELYQNQTPNSPNYDEYTVADAQADTTEGRYVDLMTRDGQAALRRPVEVEVPIAMGAPPVDDVPAEDGGVVDPPAQPGVYRFGLINFYRPIKVTAEFPIVGEPGEYFRTRATTAIHPTPGLGGGLGGERVSIGDATSGPTEETTYMLNNGGALFVFQKPFVITKSDIDAKAQINIDLVFNPDSFGQAYQMPCADDQRVVVCDPVNDVAIDMPYVRMSPVPRKSGERTRKETYWVDYEAHSKLRIELYYNEADDEASIQGVDTAIVYTAAAASASTPSGNVVASNFVSQFGSVQTNDASVTLMDYRHLKNLVNLRRRQNGTVTIYCAFTGSICPSLDATVTRSYTYEGDVVVSGP